MSTVLSREVVRFVEVKPARGTRIKALHALCVGVVTIGVLSLLYGVPMALLGMTGIFVAISAFDRSQRSRIRVLTAIAIAYTVVVALGALTSLLPLWLGVVAVAALATVTAFGYHSLLSDPPGPMLLIMGLCAASYIPTLGVPIDRLVLVTALSMVLGCTTSVLLQSGRQRAAVERQVQSLRTAVDTLEDALKPSGDGDPHQDRTAEDPDGGDGDGDGGRDDRDDDADDTGRPARESVDEARLGRLRDAAFGALFQAQASLVASTPRRGLDPRAQALEDEIHALHLRLFRAVAARELPWAHIDAAVTDHYLGAPSTRYLLAWALSPASPAWLAARRTGLAVLLGGAVATLFHFDHPYWAQMTAALVLSTAADRFSSIVRAEHRVAGTVVGVGLFYVIHLLDLPPVAIAAIVVGCGSLTQLLAPRHYALATMVMTPMPLLMASMHSTSAHVGGLMWSRVLETFIGCAAAFLMLFAQGRGGTTVLVRRQFRRALVALAQVVRLGAQAAQGGPALDEPVAFTARRNLHFEQLAAAKALAMVRYDHEEVLAPWSDFEVVLGEFTYTVLVAARTADPAHALRWGAMSTALDDFAASLPAVSGTPIDARAAAARLREILRLGRPDPT